MITLCMLATVATAKLRQPKGGLVPMEFEASSEFRGLPAGWQSTGPASGNGIKLVLP